MSFRMQTLNEEEEYNWSQKPGRDIVIAVDHGPKSKHAFDWALVHFCRPGDTIHLLHSVSSLKNDIVYQASLTLMEKLSVEAFKLAMKYMTITLPSTCITKKGPMTIVAADILLNMAASNWHKTWIPKVKVVTRIVEGDAGKSICKEAEKVRPIAVVMGTRGRSLMQSVLQGSVSEYCFHNCKAAPVIIVPGMVEAGEESVASLDKR